MSELMDEYNDICDCSDSTMDDEEEEEDVDEEWFWGEEILYAPT